MTVNYIKQLIYNLAVVFRIFWKPIRKILIEEQTVIPAISMVPHCREVFLQE